MNTIKYFQQRLFIVITIILTMIYPISAFAGQPVSNLGQFNSPTDIVTMESTMVTYESTLFYVPAGFDDYMTFKQVDKDFLANWLITNRPTTGYSSITNLRSTFASGMTQRSFMISLNSAVDSFSVWTLLSSDSDEPHLNYDVYNTLSDQDQDKVCQKLLDNRPANGYILESSVQPQLDQAISEVITDDVQQDDNSLTISYANGDSASHVTQNVLLSTSGDNGTTISWSSSNPAVIAADGTVVPPTYNQGDETVTLIATVTKGTASETKNFVLTVKKGNAASNTALRSLSLSGIILDQTVSSNVYSYTANVGNGVTSTTIQAEPVDNNANVSFQLNGNPVTNPIPLSVGSNTIVVEITAQDGVMKQDYTVSLNRGASENADLSNIRINGNLLSTFSPSVTEYTYQVPNEITDISVTGSVYDPTATVQVTGGHNLLVGSNPVTLDVTAQNLSTKHYVVDIIRAGSSNTQLSNLSTNVGELSPMFNGTIYQYSTDLPNSVAGISVTANVYDPNATIQVDGTPLSSGASSGLIPLQVGSNSIQVLVTAQDHSTASYTITANRAANSIAELSGLVVNQGTLAPVFDPGITTYNLDVSNGTDSLSVTASVYDPNATIKINGTPVVSGTISNPISLQVGSNVIQVIVLAQDGVTSKTYTLNVTRYGHSSESILGGGGGGSSSAISGQLTVNSSQPGTTVAEASSPATLTKMLGSNVSLTATVLTTDGKSTGISDITIGSDGQFQVGKNVTPGQYPVIINVTAPTGEVLAGNSGTLTVSANGTASMQTNLIDPYGVIEDSVTKQPISGVNVQLYWADTDLNRSKGRTPGTVVKLPELPDFAPNQNHNPQVSTTDGRYGWMVFPDGDYYVVAEKDGYETYDSRKDLRDESQGNTSYIRNGLIHVGKTMVELNFTMTNTSQDTKDSGYVKGYADGTFRPGNSITRAELAAMLSRVLSLSSSMEIKNVYQDVPTAHWAMQPIQEMIGNQVMGGYPDGTFHPDSPITRAEMASIVTRVKHLEPKQKAAFEDSMNHWAAASIGAVQTTGIMGGYPDGTFHPDQPLTRAETVTIVNRMLGKTLSQHTSQATWKDVPSTYWAYDQIEEASR